MNSPAEADAPQPAQRDTDSAWGTKLALGVVGFLLIVEFVLPGFLAAGFSRSGLIVFQEGGKAMITWGAYAIGGIGPPSRAQRVEMAILAPSARLMAHSQSVRRFYEWQYRLAGGSVIEISD